MNNIRAKKLKSLTSIAAGHPIRGSVDGLPSGDVSVVQMRNVISAHDIDWQECAKVELPTKREPEWLQEGDILLSTRGTHNYAALITSPPPKAVAAPSFFVLRVNSKTILVPGFLCWLLNQPPAQLYFQRSATGSYILNLRRVVVEEMPIALPSIAHQQDLSELFRLSAQEKHIFEQLISNRQQQLETLAARLYESLEI